MDRRYVRAGYDGVAVVTALVVYALFLGGLTPGRVVVAIADGVTSGAAWLDRGGH